MSPLSAEVIIIGAGLAGNTLACLLASRGLDCIVIDAGNPAAVQEEVPPDPRALAITHASKRILESIGAWQGLPTERIGYFSGMHVWDENGRGNIDFDSADLCQPALGYIVEQSVLQAGLGRTVAALTGVRVYAKSKLESIQWHDDAISVTLSSNEKLSAKLLVGADGTGSRSRELAGITSIEKDYHQHALACIVRTGLAHAHVARQRFLRQGPLAFLPMHADDQCGVVWSCSPEQADRLLHLQEREFNQVLQEAFDYTLGEIKQSDCRRSFPLRRAEAQHYCRDRFALVGDAAHSIHPLAGQGANLAFLDVASLAQLLLAAREKNRDIAGQRVLRAYARWRKYENKIMMMTLEGFKYTFENQSGPVPLLRNKALDFADSIIPLKHTIMRHAMGLSGDLPELAKGHNA